MASVSPYLDAIQAIEGTTPETKYKTIIKQIKNHVNIKTKEIDPVIWDETEKHLQPLYKLIIANMIEDYDMISDLLKSEDVSIISRVLKCKWYFQGKNKNVINPEYFFQNIIPFATLVTRKEIAKALGRYLKNTSLAAEFFNAFLENFGIQYSIPLLFACNDEFIKKQILEHKIIFTINQIDRLYLRKPNVVTYYFGLIRLRNNGKLSFNISDACIRRYGKFLPKLIKNNHTCFYEFYKAWGNELGLCKLDKRYAKAILKRRDNGKRLLEEDPKVYINLIPLQLIDETTMNTIFPKLLPTNVKDFNINYMLLYLEYYPSNKKYKLISESYEAMYNEPFTKNLDNFSFELIPLLPRTLRTEMLHLLKSHLKFSTNINDYVRNYDCYLPTSFNLQRIKTEINKSASVEERSALVIQMIYNCKINDDNCALRKFLDYIDRRHKNEKIIFWNLFFHKFNQIYNYTDIRIQEWIFIDKIIKNIYTQNMLYRIQDFCTILQNSIIIKYKEIPTHKSLKEMIDILLETVREHGFYSWCRYEGNPEDEDFFFTKMVDCVEEKFSLTNPDSNTNPAPDPDPISDSDLITDIDLDPVLDLESNPDPNPEPDLEKWNKNVKIRLITDLVRTMYDLDDKFSLYTKKKIRKKRLLSKPFRRWRSTWLWQQVEDILLNKEEIDKESIDCVYTIEKYVKNRDPEIYAKLLNIPIVKEMNFLVSEPFKILKNKPKEVLQQLTLFLDIAEKTRNMGKVKRFFLNCRWYENIPMKFLEEVKKRLAKNRLFYLYFLAFILDGESYKNFIVEYINNCDKVTDDSDVTAERLSYDIVWNALQGIQMANPPISIEIIDNFHKYKYRMNTLEISKNVGIQTSMHKIQHYIQTMSNKQISVKKNAIRIFFTTQTIDKCAEYFLLKWNEDEHHSIRQYIFQKSYELFQSNPREKTWNTFKNCLKTYKQTDWDYYPPASINTDRIPEEYINELVELSISMAAEMIDKGNNNNREKGLEFLRSTLIDNLSDYTAKILDDKIFRNFIEKYLFNRYFMPSKLMIVFTVEKYLFIDEEKYLSRIQDFGDIFERINHEWRDPVLKNQPYHPVRLTIVQFVEKIMATLLEYNSMNKLNPNTCGKIIDEMTKIFFKVPIYNDIRSYILLQLTKFYIVTPNEFIDKVCDIVVNECKKQKCSYPILTTAIEEFFMYRREYDLLLMKFNFIKGLLKNDKCSLSKMTAVSLLPVPPYENYYTQYYEILEQVKALQDEEVFCLLYDKINRVDLKLLI